MRKKWKNGKLFQRAFKTGKRVMMNKKKMQIKYITRVGYALSLFIVGVALRFISKSYIILGNVALGISVVMFVFCLLKVCEPKFPKAVRIINKLLTYGVILFCFAFATTEGAVIYGYETGNEDNDNPKIETVKADYLVVLGASVEDGKPSNLLKFRLETAFKYLCVHKQTVCIVTGGKTLGSDISEAECMYDWLVEKGISGERIIKEEMALDTYQNFKFSYEIIEKLAENADVAVVTGDYHVLRAKLMAKVQGYDPVMLSAETKGILVKANYYVREVFAIWNRLLLGYETA